MSVRADTQDPKPVFLKDYKPPAFAIDALALRFELDSRKTRVTATSQMRRQAGGTEDLVLDGARDMTLHGVQVNGAVWPANRMRRDAEHLTLLKVPDRFELTIVTEVHPAANTRLEGLYQSDRALVTQCEAEGFRHITFFLDRPDVMARYTVRLEADQERFPVLLSNGNCVDAGALPGGRHYAVWVDPFPKPSYLFALVAGDLAPLQDRFTTRSGRNVKLSIWAVEEDLPKCRHAMDSLKRAMQWDEQVYGLEYDLDEFNIVAVADFNMGAMENKSLNLFNTKYVLASPDTATDDDFDSIEGVVAHEYFHNWTGNRITCRDWFQLSLKEGLTVFRDQQFSAAMGSPGRQRIQDVRTLRAIQFPEDAGPLAHPVRPDSYIEINNFYTATVYNKGAEVIRMLHTLLGPEAYRAGIDEYVRRHDGQAVRCEDFVSAMEAASKRDLAHFRLWYGQAGTPTLTARGHYDADTQRYYLSLAQETQPTPGQPHKQPLHIPVNAALFGPNGEKLDVSLIEGDGETLPDGGVLLHLRQAEQDYVFGDVGSRPVASLLRGFSAPVRLDDFLSLRDRIFLMAHEDDAFAKWEACQQAGAGVIMAAVADRAAGRPMRVDPLLCNAFGQVLETTSLDPALAAEMLVLPSEIYLGQQMNVVDVDGLFEARRFVRQTLAQAHLDRVSERYRALRGQDDRGARRLAGVLLGYLAAAGEDQLPQIERHYEHAANMTERLAAFHLLVDSQSAAREQVIKDFYRRFEREALVIDKWFAAQATASRPQTLAEVRRLMDHPAFTIKNPNRLRALVGAFANGNQIRFHSADGAGYELLTEVLRTLDPINPQTAARLVAPLTRWRRFDEHRADQMRACLNSLQSQPGLSRDLFEIVSKSLG
ncbi:MAG: aminopeptidase N [Rhodothalassiaceae bacterium]